MRAKAQEVGSIRGEVEEYLAAVAEFQTGDTVIGPLEQRLKRLTSSAPNSAVVTLKTQAQKKIQETREAQGQADLAEACPATAAPLPFIIGYRRANDTALQLYRKRPAAGAQP